MGRIPAAYYLYLHSVYVSSAWNDNPTLPPPLQYFFIFLNLMFYQMKEEKIRNETSKKQEGVYIHTCIIYC